MECVPPQLKVTIRTDNKDWRFHVDLMQQHESGTKSPLKETKGFLDKLQMKSVGLWKRLAAEKSTPTISLGAWFKNTTQLKRSWVRRGNDTSKEMVE